MARLTWHIRALRDLDVITDRIAEDSPVHAEQVARRVFGRATLLLQQPRQGRRLPEYDGPRDVREVFVRLWRVIYEVKRETITILAIIHGARLVGNADPL